MQIKLKATDKDVFPKCGFFIQNRKIDYWIDVLDQLNIDPTQIEIYGLPSKTANEIWGCLVLGEKIQFPEQIGPNFWALDVDNQLIIPEKTEILPKLTPNDMKLLFRSDKSVFHTDFGLFKLELPINLSQHIKFKNLTQLNAHKPIIQKYPSGKIISFRIQSKPIEEIKANLDVKVERERIKDKPLSFFEKAKLKLYNHFLDINNKGEVIRKISGANLEHYAKKLGIVGEDRKEQMYDDFKDLHDRNKREVDKLLDMLQNDPELALRYAIPLDEHGYSRGKETSSFRLQDRGLDFSLFSGIRNGGSGRGIDLGDEYFRLQDQYRKTAKILKEKGEYEKASFIYLKLLKSYAAAAQTLLEGKLYDKAAVVYLEYLKNTEKAAQCFEQGKFYEKAIELYEKDNKLEKAGDLYLKIGMQKKANILFQKVVDQYLADSKHLKASFLSKNKLRDFDQAQEILLSGWRADRDSFNCLNNYFNNVHDEVELWNSIQFIDNNEVNEKNEKTFLKALKYIYDKNTQLADDIQNMAYEKISKMLEQGTISAKELIPFNKTNKRLKADTLRYRLSQNKRLT